MRYLLGEKIIEAVLKEDKNNDIQANMDPESLYWILDKAILYEDFLSVFSELWSWPQRQEVSVERILDLLSGQVQLFHEFS